MQNGTPTTTPKKNAKRVQAGRLNQQKSHGLTTQGRDKLRTAIQLRRPWLHSTGPVTPAGKARSRENGSLTRRGDKGGRAMRREMAAVADLINQTQNLREQVSALSVKKFDCERSDT